MLSLLTTALPSILGLGGKLIEDKDKRAEFAFNVQKMGHELMLKLLDTKTYPIIDGLVKLAYAGEAITKGLLRPLGSAALTGVVIYCAMNDIELPDSINIIGSAAFPGWMTSRHIEKGKKKKEIEEDEFW